MTFPVPPFLLRRRHVAGAVGAALVAGAALVVATRRATLRRYTSLLDRPGVDADGVLPGARSLDLAAPADAADDRAALILHGFGDTPQSVAYLAGYLNFHGYAVRAPLLPGHGSTLRDFGRSTAAEWLEHSRAELAAMRQRHRRVVLVGQSMGGALATILAAREPGPPALVLLAPYLGMPAGTRWLARMHRLWEPLLPFVSSAGEQSILDEKERSRSLSYGAVNGAVLRELLAVVESATDALPCVTCPLLLVQSRKDNRITPEVARTAFARFASSRKQLVWADEGGHVLAVDRGHERIFALITSWLDAEFARAASRSAQSRQLPSAVVRPS